MSYKTNRRTKTKFPDTKFLEVYGRTKGAGEIIKSVSEFGDEYQLVQNYSEVQDILGDTVRMSKRDRESYSHLLILPGDGFYKEIWGIEGLPYMDSSAVLLYRGN